MAELGPDENALNNFFIYLFIFNLGERVCVVWSSKDSLKKKKGNFTFIVAFRSSKTRSFRSGAPFVNLLRAPSAEVEPEKEALVSTWCLKLYS